MSRVAPLLAAALLLPAAAQLASAQEPTPAPSRGGGQELPEILRQRDPSPLLDPQALQARTLLGLRAEVAALILRGEVGGGIGVATLAVPLLGETPQSPRTAAAPPSVGGDDSASEPPAGPRVPVQLFVEIDGASFLDTHSGDLDRLEVYVYAIDELGGVVGHLAEAFAVDVPRLGEAIWQGGLKLYARLELPPGELRLRTLVRNAQSGAAGLSESALAIPVPGGTESMAYPLFRTPEGRDAWIPVRSWGDGPDVRRPRYPFVVGGEAVSPAALPVLTAGRPASALLFDPSRQEPGRRTAPRLELRSSDGSRPIEIEVAASSPSGERGAIELRFDVPEVTTGDYTLCLAGQAAARVPVVVVADESGERSLVWTDLRWRLGGGERFAEAGDAARIEVGDGDGDGDGKRRRAGRRSRSGGRRTRQAGAAYRAALSPLLGGSGSNGGPGDDGAAGDESWLAARASLFEYQSSSLGEGNGGSLSALQTGALTTAQSLAASGREALPVLIQLHEELYGSFRERKVFSLASYNRLMVEALAELYAESGGDPRIAADALVSLGGYLQEANLPSSASRLFQRALALDPASVEAHLALAALFERLGAPRRAAEQLGPAVEAAPDHAEAKLRLAINLARSGDRRRARELLADVAAASGPGWVRSLAVQELARQDLATGNAEAAAELIERHLSELPEDRGLQVLLANAYDRMKRPQEALALLSSLAPTREESPRRRYDGWPRDALSTARRRLEQAAAERRPELVAELEKGR